MNNFKMKLKMKKKNINEQIFKECFKYHSPSFLVKDLYKNNQNGKIVKYIYNSLFDLRKSIKSKKIPKD